MSVSERSGKSPWEKRRKRFVFLLWRNDVFVASTINQSKNDQKKLVSNLEPNNVSMWEYREKCFSPNFPWSKRIAEIFDLKMKSFVEKNSSTEKENQIFVEGRFRVFSIERMNRIVSWSRLLWRWSFGNDDDFFFRQNLNKKGPFFSTKFSMSSVMRQTNSNGQTQ